MSWYKNMSKQQQRAFQFVIAVCIVGVIAILLVPVVSHTFFS